MSSWKLFPILPGTKKPAFEGWQSLSTDDQLQIETWREQGFDLAVDCEKSGLTVIDPDGIEGLANAAGMDLPRTYTMQTPRGGQHRYYRGLAPSSVQRLAPKVDTRGIGGYAVWEAPGYELVDDAPVADLPDWVTPALNVRKDHKPAAVDSLDLPQNIKRAVAYLSIRKPAIEGEGGNDHTYKTACALQDLGISADLAIALMAEEWNARCLPPWDGHELTNIVVNAYTYGQNEAGAQAFDFNPETRFQGVALEAAPEKPSRFRLWSLAEARSRPKPSFLFPGILPAKAFGVAYGPMENGKTWLIIDMCMRIALGWTLDGQPVNKPRDVVFFAGEGFEDIVHNRCDAWCDYHGVPRDPPRFHLMENFPDVTSEEDMDEAAKEIIKRVTDLGLLTVDTYARAMAEGGLSENDPLDVMKFVRQMETFKRGFRCTVLAIHHSGKDIERQARGSNALLAAADFGFEITADWNVMALKLACAKMKGAKRFDPLHYEAIEHGESLVVRGITASAYKTLTHVEDMFSSRSIGVALAKLGAADPLHAVTSHVLASTLYVAQVDEPEMEVQAKLDRIVRKLNALGKGRLEQYVSRDGWSLPK